MAAIFEHEFDVGFDEGFEFLGVGVLGVDFFDDVGIGGFEEFSDALFEEIVFVFEVVGNDSGADPGALRNFGDGGLGESFLGYGLDCGIDDLLAANLFNKGRFFDFCSHGSLEYPVNQCGFMLDVIKMKQL